MYITIFIADILLHAELSKDSIMMHRDKNMVIGACCVTTFY